MGPRAIRPASVDGWASHSSPGPERGGQTCLPSESEEAETRGKPLRASWVLAAAAPRGPAAFLLWSREIPCFSHDEVLTAQASSNWLHLICHQMALRRTHGLSYYIKGLSMRRGRQNALPREAGRGGWPFPPGRTAHPERVPPSRSAGYRSPGDADTAGGRACRCFTPPSTLQTAEHRRFLLW